MAFNILSSTYDGNGQTQGMPNDEAGKFAGAAEEALKKIRASSLGVELENEIKSADCDLKLLEAGQGRTNSCLLQRQDKAARDHACYKEVLGNPFLIIKIGELHSKGVITLDHPAVKKFRKFYVKGQNRKNYERMTGAFSGHVKGYPVAHKGAKPVHTTDNILRGRVSEDNSKAEIAEAVGCVRSLQNGLIGYHIMSHLTPGPGTDALVVWDPTHDASAGVDPSKRAPWMTRPSWIALVHELIHGWRLVTGRCLFRPDNNIEEYYEEAMTVGLPPYDGCKFTENKFRMLAGEPQRRFYGETTRALSEAAQQKHKRLMDQSV